MVSAELTNICLSPTLPKDSNTESEYPDSISEAEYPKLKDDPEKDFPTLDAIRTHLHYHVMLSLCPCCLDHDGFSDFSDDNNDNDDGDATLSGSVPQAASAKEHLQAYAAAQQRMSAAQAHFQHHYPSGSSSSSSSRHSNPHHVAAAAQMAARAPPNVTVHPGYNDLSVRLQVCTMENVLSFAYAFARHCITN